MTLLKPRFKAIASALARRLRGVAVLVLIGLAFAAGLWLRTGSSTEAPAAGASHEGHEQAEAVKEEVWTCSMHPQIRQPKPGACPLCGMDLIPVAADDGDDMEETRRFTTSPAAAELMKVETYPVERRFAEARVRMVGKVAYDETRLSYITSWVSGRIDEMYVDYTGMRVQKDDHMVSLYSPELLTAQEELRRAAESLKSIRSGASEIISRTARSTLEAGREKLRRWGLTPDQIARAEASGTVSDHITIYAPVGGTVIHRNGQEGMYVDTGTRIFTIADMSVMWVMLDAYESDLPWIKYGQKVTFQTEAYPGEIFEGTITFIDPFLNATTRTVKVRVNVPNPDGKLKPEMFVRAVARAKVATGGRVMDAALAGKWISPMHPEIVKDGPGSCDVCGMPLVPVEELGYVTRDESSEAKPLVIPVTAALVTGTRAVVYVAVPDMERPTFEGREVVLGPRAGDFYIVHAGLSEGEQVVTNGNFKIDSALQILAKPSMMMPEDNGDDEGHDHVDGGTRHGEAEAATTSMATKSPAPEAFREQLAEVLNAYFALTSALAKDTLDAAKASVDDLEKTVSKVDMTLLDSAAHDAWMGQVETIRAAVKALAAGDTLAALRLPLKPLSDALASAVVLHGVELDMPIYKVHCPMAFDFDGADWLQTDQDVLNPYFGAEMLGCGSVTGRIHDGAADAADAATGQHQGEGSSAKMAE